jgi:hypothetical protein
MVTYHYVKFYVSIIIQLEVININVQNFKFPIGYNVWRLIVFAPFLLIIIIIKSPKQRLETYCFCSVSYIIIIGAKTISLQTLFGRLNKIWL